MTTKITFALVAIAVFAMGGMTITPALATEVEYSSLVTKDAIAGTMDVSSKYFGNVCNSNNTHYYKHTISNGWGANKIVATWDTSRGSTECDGFQKITVKLFVDGQYKASKTFSGWYERQGSTNFEGYLPPTSTGTFDVMTTYTVYH